MCHLLSLVTLYRIHGFIMPNLGVRKLIFGMMNLWNRLRVVKENGFVGVWSDRVMLTGASFL